MIPGKFLSIATHNVFWFQGLPSRENVNKISREEILEKFVKTYKLLKADILCFQEVKSPDSVRYFTEKLSMDGIYTEGVQYKQYGGAILYNKRLNIIRYQVLKTMTRFSQIAIFNFEGLKISICNLHLPSGVYIRNASQKRIEEISYVLAHNNPQIILGDFNAQPSEKIYDYMLTKGYIDVAALLGKTENTTINGKRIDYIWVTKELKDDIAGCEVYKNIIYGKTFLSDHYPVKVTIRLG